ncbi:MAG: hypothetical protein KC589_00795 [Nanoarchaeota archaeon]|nr:hypothetical protein [Nanoarchaeota archaeon]
MATFKVKPFLSAEKDTIGLKEYGLKAFPGTKTIIEVPIIYDKYLTGFDPDAFYLEQMGEKEKKKEQDNIKAKVKEFDRKYPSFRVGDVAIQNILLPNGSYEYRSNPFYANMVLELNSDLTILNTEDPESLVKIDIIKTNAKYNPHFDIAPDLRTAQESNRNYKYYIDNAETDIEHEVSAKKIINKAIGILDDLSANNKEKFILVVKFLLPTNKSYNFETENRLYKRADDYINGIIEGEKVKGGETFYNNFIQASEMEIDELYTKVVIKYAILTNIIRLNTKSKEFEYSKTLQEMGKTPEEVYRFLTNPKNLEVKKEITIDTKSEIRIV